MNIRQAKIEIINTIKSYQAKKPDGSHFIPVNKQRPVLLMGPPGIGKTDIMYQIAKELDINLVSYTITHHTRQSAIGLPFIEHKTIDGKDYTVTEYTMSEIIGAVHNSIESSGNSKGILFLDEINCVSETLAPTMLQFLQYKTFGSYKLPEDFVVVCAGNPPEYNKSVRDFDIVTLDRLKRIDISEDFGVWKEYGYNAKIHGAILAYLEIKKKNFYSIGIDLDGKHFVTARGWEDLSLSLLAYESLNIEISYGFIREFLQDDNIAKDFFEYYVLYNKYKEIYKIKEVLLGSFPKDTEQFKNAPFDEKLSILGLLMEALSDSPDSDKLSNAFSFILNTYGEGQEMVLFLTEINRNLPLLMYIAEHGCREYYKYNELLLTDNRTEQLKNEIKALI